MSTSDFLPNFDTSSNTAYRNASQGSIQSAGSGISGGYDGNSLAWKVIIALFCSLAIYNAIELIVLVFVTFQKFHGVYFTSMLVASASLIPYATGFLLKFFRITTGNYVWISIVLLSIGWWGMVTGQALVLYSRLHLLCDDRRLLRGLLFMIIIDALIFCIPTTILTFGANSGANPDRDSFIRGYSIMEKVQMTGFFIQELILSGLYVRETVRILRSSLQENTRQLMIQLLSINVLIILMDCGLVALEYANLYILQTTLKGVIYAVKLKLEYAVLSRLVHFVGGRDRGPSISFDPTNLTAPGTTEDIEENKEGRMPSSGGSGIDGVNGVNGLSNVQDFVDLTRITSDVTHARSFAGSEMYTDQRVSNFERNCARLAAGQSPLQSPRGSSERLDHVVAGGG